MYNEIKKEQNEVIEQVLSRIDLINSEFNLLSYEQLIEHKKYYNSFLKDKINILEILNQLLYKMNKEKIGQIIFDLHLEFAGSLTCIDVFTENISEMINRKN